MENTSPEGGGKLTQTKNQPWKAEGDTCTRKINVAGLSAKSHPHARLAALRRMWSNKHIEENEPEEKVSDEEKPKVKVKMMRVKKPKDEMEVDEESHPKEENPEEKVFEEEGYKIRTRGNQCEADTNDVLETINCKEIILEEEFVF